MKRRTRLAALAFGAALCLSPGCRPAPTTAGKANEPDAGTDPGATAPRAGNAGANDPKGNGPRGKGGSGVTYVKDGDGSFRVGDPGRVELAQGGSRSFEVPIVREGGFASEVKFSLRPPAGVRGVTFSPADWQLGSNESSKTVTARAEPNSSVGSFTWTLVVRPRVGKEQTRTLTVVVGPRR